MIYLGKLKMINQVEKFLSKIMGGTSTEREIKHIRPIVGRINEFAKSYESLTDDELKAKTQEFKFRLRMGETLDEILPEAFAAVKDTCRRLLGQKWLVRGQEVEWNMVPYDVQLMGAIVLHDGKIAEMATGEGKTLVATMPLYLNALEGKGAHLVTVNDYLAQRDCEWMGRIYEFLGLHPVAMHNDMPPEERRKAYYADITYGTNNEFGFDYLRDNMATDLWSVVQRSLNYAIVDEVDSVLIDEARTPLIISGAVGAPRNVYNELKPVVANIYRRQQDLVGELIKQGKALLEQDEDEAGLALLRAQRGDPKNAALLEILTSEFWVKKLIERLQGQHEINKTMGEVDAELYYVIDEKSHVVDITEKGRIFLSGGRDQDIVYKTQKLDELDKKLFELSEQKQASRYFVQNSITGLCNGLSLEGKVALCKGAGSVSAEEQQAVEDINARLLQMPEQINAAVQSRKSDKASEWRRYYGFAKKMERTVSGLLDPGREFLLQNSPTEQYTQAVSAFSQLLEIIRNDANVDEGTEVARSVFERRKSLQETFFDLDKQFGCPIGLHQEGKTALIVLLRGGDPLSLPFIFRIEKMLSDEESSPVSTNAKDENSIADVSIEDRRREYFEFSDNGAILKHVAEKGRIALLGGQPDLYVLPDRSIVEERDRQVQDLLDRSLNQSHFDYAAKVVAIERLEQEIELIGRTISSAQPDKRAQIQAIFYDIDAQSAANHFKITDRGKAVISDFSEQTRDVVLKFDEDLRASKNNLSKIFTEDDEGNFLHLSAEEIDRLMGMSFDQVKNKISEWHQLHAGNSSQNSIELRMSLDDFLSSAFSTPSDQWPVSLSRRFEEVERINRMLTGLFKAYYQSEATMAEKQRLLRRYFSIDSALAKEQPGKVSLPLNGLSDSGTRAIMGEAEDRSQVAERLFGLVEDRDVDLGAVFEMHGDSHPLRLKKAARSQLVDGLPFFSYTDELHKFRDEILRMSAKKVNSRAELDSILPKDKAQLRSRRFLLDDREMVELISKAHAPNSVVTTEEIEHWFRIHFERRPRQVLDARRDRLWREFNDVEERVQNISQLLRAYTLYHRDVDYVVKALEEAEMRGRASARGGKAVLIVDQFTGRLMPGRRFSDGLHEALEAKEGVEVQAESQTLATITIQNFFRLYKKLAGMTGTAETESQEFFSTYKLEVVVVPTNKPVVRKDFDDVIFRTRREKYSALIDEAIEMHEQGRPVLVGTVSVDVSQHLSDMLTARGVPIANWLKKGDVSRELESGRFHTVLNAKFHKQEAEIVAKAGLQGTITIATNMAGRGTDIKLLPEVVKRGGLHIVGSEKHEARRIDRQLRGRAGRQGDPGSSRFYLSLEDDLMRLFGSDRITNIMSRLGPAEEGERIEHPLITRSIERAQKKVEERNFDIRKNLLEYDDVLNEQRKIIYKRRQNLLGFAQAGDYVESKSKRYFSEEDERGDWKLDELIADLARFFGRNPEVTAEELGPLKYSEIRELLEEWVDDYLTQDRHLKQMQQRHRIMGYCSVDALLDELVRIKIRLHSAGTRDISHWNFDGIKHELDRIFGTSPDWLKDHAAFQNAGQVESRIAEWAKNMYWERAKEHKEGFEYAVFAALPFLKMIEIFIFALMNAHLNAGVPPFSWTTDEFLNDLERVFLARPNLGGNEIRTIRREKIAEILRQWLASLPIKEEDHLLIRHRILGFTSTFRFAEVAASFVLSSEGEEDGRNLTALSEEQQSLLTTIFGAPLQENETIEQGQSFVNQAVQQIRQVFIERLEESMAAYDAMMLASASIEELIEASINVLIQDIVQKEQDAAAAQRVLSQYLENVFLQKPDKSLPAERDDLVLASFKEDMVAWALSLYQLYADREDRLRQESLSSEIVRDSVLMMIDDIVYAAISNSLEGQSEMGPNELRHLEADCRLVFRQSPRLSDDSDAPMDPNAIMDQLCTWAQNLYRRRVDEIGGTVITRYERYYILEKIDENWRQHLSGVDELREGIGLRGYGQKDPLLEYKSEAYKMFVKMIDKTNRDIVSTLFRVFDVGGEIEEQQIRRTEPKSYMTTHSQVEIFKQVMSAKKQPEAAKGQPQITGPRRTPVVKSVHVGRNDPCPCGSGKKYKHCCGKSA
jgi:preprotein translocase subunit SecA